MCVLISWALLLLFYDKLYEINKALSALLWTYNLENISWFYNKMWYTNGLCLNLLELYSNIIPLRYLLKR